MGISVEVANEDDGVGPSRLLNELKDLKQLTFLVRHSTGLERKEVE